MKVIPPLVITDAMLTSTTVVEAAPSAYAGGTTYALDATASVAGTAGLITVYKSLQNGNVGHTPASSPTWWTDIGQTYQVYSNGATYAALDRVIDATAHKVYESAVGSNTGNALSDTTKWLLIGPDNRWAMFDTIRNTASAQPLALTVVITPSVRVNSIALMGLAADTAQVSITSSAVSVYDTTALDLHTRDVMSWLDYFTKAFDTQKSLVLFDLPPVSDAVITVTLTAGSGDAECGACVLGNYVDIGTVQSEADSDVLNFSTVDRDFDGQISTMIQRRNVPKTVQNVWLDKAFVNRARILRDALNGTPAVWAGIDDSTDEYFEAILILGFYRRFSISLRMRDKAVISLELEEI